MFGILFNYQLAFFQPSSLLLFLRETRIPRLLEFWSLIINLLSPARLLDFLFYMELASLCYMGFGVYLIINFLSPGR